MSNTSRFARASVAVLLASTATVLLGGCSWFSKGPKGDYALAAEERAVAEGDVRTARTFGADFHELVVTMAGNRLLSELSDACAASGAASPSRPAAMHETIRFTVLPPS